MNNLLQQILQNNQAMQNPMFRNAMEMYKNGNTQGLQQMAENLAKERGVSINDVQNSIKQRFGIR